jgi:ribosomal-protein-serine acetyltransferase
MNFTIIVREGLELRLRTESDADAFFKVTEKNRTYLRQWLPWVDATKTTDDTRKYIQSCISKFEKQESIDSGIWYEGQWVGSMGFHYWDKANRKDTIGYWLSEDFQGKGIVTDAVRALIKYGFEEMKLNRIEILCAVENKKSRAIPERLGFKNEGVTRQCEWLYDHFVDSVTYSLLLSEWLQNK